MVPWPRSRKKLIVLMILEYCFFLYEFEPAPGVKVSKIINLSEDLARNTSSTSARVSVIPGKNTVGIEIPNEGLTAHLINIL